MRIGFDAKRAFSNGTGLGNYSRTTINALQRFAPENEYILYTSSTRNKHLYDPPAGIDIRLPSTLWSKQLKAYWRTYGISKQLPRDSVELYHGLSNEIPVGIEKSGVKSVVTIHDLIFMSLPKLYKPIDRRIYQKKTKHAIKNADRIIAISGQTRDDLVTLLGADEQKIRVVFQGCNPWFYAKASDEEKTELKNKYNLPGDFLLYVGTIEERKNLLSVVRALHESSIDIPLVAIGRKTPYFDKVEAYIQENKLKNIHVLHEIKNTDLPGIYQQAMAFVYPSFYEGFGIPVLEALNSGIPVITSRGGCLEETAGPGAHLVEAGNLEELAEGIRKVISDSKFQQNLSEAGKKHALNYREEKTIPQLLNVYEECFQ